MPFINKKKIHVANAYGMYVQFSLLNSGSVNSGSVNSGSVNSGSVNSGYVNSGSVNSEILLIQKSC